MNPFIKVVIVIVAIVVLAISAIFIVRTVSGNQFEEITYSDLENMKVESKVKQIIYLYRPDCPACQTYKPTLSAAAKEADVKVYSLNLDKLNQEELEGLKEMFSAALSQKGEVQSPTLGVLSEGAITDTLVGVQTKGGTIDFFEENGVTEKPANPFEK